MQVVIDRKPYQVNIDEFNIVPHEIYNHLQIKESLGEIERTIGFLTELQKSLDIDQLVVVEPTHGGFLPIQCSKFYKHITLFDISPVHKENVLYNIKEHKVEHILFDIIDHTDKNMVLYSDYYENIDLSFVEKYKPFLVTQYHSSIVNKNWYKHILQFSETLYVYIPDQSYSQFYDAFHYYLNEKNPSKLDYDNLIHLCIMVKNAGPQFEEMLTNNLPIIDKWTILDTGSTDNTMNIVKKVLGGKKKGNLYQEPFLNFRDSRNRLLELAGTDCKFNLMLDDTYSIKGDLRRFLTQVRGDQISDSFSLFIQSDDIEYVSNRLLKSYRNLKYLYKIHEVVQEEDNHVVIVPKNDSFIFDYRCDYMEKRTNSRNESDLKILYQELEEDPDNTRTYYYLAKTYNNMENHEKAYEFYLKRINHTKKGFTLELIDCTFEAARTANFKLNKPWDECEKLYLKAFDLEPKKPEALYFIGIHYFLENKTDIAFAYLKKAFEIGYPADYQFNVKPVISFLFIPKFLSLMCYQQREYQLGFQASKMYLANKNIQRDDMFEVILSWHKIFQLLVAMKPASKSRVMSTSKPILCFVADGGFHPWTGRDILTKGIGGSETWVIEMARYIQKSGHFQVYVFCNCSKEETFEEVEYLHLRNYLSFCVEYDIHTCIVSRYSEYLPATFESTAENVYLILHDLGPTGVVIPIHKKLKKVFCLSEWHVGYFTERFPALKHLTMALSYGCDMNNFDIQKDYTIQKNQYQFIYSSFPNRGLLPLLEMWPSILHKQPVASLHIFSDVDGEWVNQVAPETMQKIKDLLSKYKEKGGLNITYHGWVSKDVLAKAWKTSDFWLYPCTFMETFCLTALEAAISKTMVITSDLAALKNNVGNRGILIPGNPETWEWKNDALIQLFDIMDNKEKINHYVSSNYDWAKRLTWENQANLFMSLIPNKHVGSFVDSSFVERKMEIKENNVPVKEKHTLLAKEHHKVDLEKNVKGLDYNNMFNWTNDLPTGSKQIFEDMITYFNKKNIAKPRILEVGVFAGTSLINIVHRIPHSVAISVDQWKTYIIDLTGIEETFHKNVVSAGMQERIVAKKGDSFDVLSSMLVSGDFFDFIYVDGSRMCLDCYADIMLAWKILNKGGILVIDDYPYLKENMLESPFEAVNHFMKKYKFEMKILNIGYRVFLEKI